MYKLPRVTVLFWIMKIAATTLGETGGDLLAQTLHVGYLAGSAIFLAAFLVSLLAQMRADRYHPALFWLVILTTSTAGTTMSDFLNRSAGLGYPAGAAVLLACLAVVFVVWSRSGQTMDVERITGPRGELLYWVAILFSNTLGTSTGDFLADSTGLGFALGAALIAVVMLGLVAAHYLTSISGVVLFWIAFVLTRPLGATAGDTLSKPTDEGGLGLGTTGTSAVLAALLVGLVGYVVLRNRTGTDGRIGADTRSASSSARPAS